MNSLALLLSACLLSRIEAHELSPEGKKPCITPDNRNGNCILLENCPELNELVKRLAIPGTDSSPTRNFLAGSQCGYLVGPNRPLVCCRTYDSPEIVTDHPNLPLINSQTCGKYAPNRIHGGNVTKIDEFRWMALLGYHVTRGTRFKCAGTVVSDRYVLTAAHCVTGSLIPVFVRLGEHDLSNNVTEQDCEEGHYRNCNKPPQDMDIDNIIVHPLYSRKPLINDIALIRLSGTVDLDSIETICLPVGIQEQTKNVDSKNSTVTGWGATETGASFSNILLQANIPVVTNAHCNAIYKIMKDIEVRDQMMCGKGKKMQDSCNGDSGGPLMLSGIRPFSLIQYGIVSYGPRVCGTTDFPGVYTRVNHYMKWILDNLTP